MINRARVTRNAKHQLRDEKTKRMRCFTRTTFFLVFIRVLPRPEESNLSPCNFVPWYGEDVNQRPNILYSYYIFFLHFFFLFFCCIARHLFVLDESLSL